MMRGDHPRHLGLTAAQIKRQVRQDAQRVGARIVQRVHLRQKLIRRFAQLHPHGGRPIDRSPHDHRREDAVQDALRRAAQHQGAPITANAMTNGTRKNIPAITLGEPNHGKISASDSAGIKPKST